MAAKGRLFDLADLLASGAIRPVVTRTLPLAQAAEAQRLLETRAAIGKLVLVV
jgi:NADPH:quinone reductase-like Zn-dependent oxidoreductase